MSQGKEKSEVKRMKMLTIFLPTTVIDTYDDLAKEAFIPNRTEGFRMAITDYMMRLLAARKETRHEE